MSAAFTKKELIADRLVERAASIWGIEHPDLIDPIVQLLVDVLAYELSRIGLEMAESDGKQLERLASIMIPSSSILPRPPHALMTALPLEAQSMLRRSDQFYLPIKEKNANGAETLTEYFFTPLQNTALVRARVACKVLPGRLTLFQDQGQSIEIRSNKTARPVGSGVWLGLEVADGLAELDALPISVHLPEGSVGMEALLPMLRWSLGDEQALVASPYRYLDALEEEEYDGEKFDLVRPELSIWRSIASCYRNRLFSLRASGGEGLRFVRSKFPHSIEDWFDAAQWETIPKPLVWLHVDFPAAFSMEVVEQAQFMVNCIPMVGRSLHYLQCRSHAGQNIIPLRIPENGTLLHVESVVDDKGQKLQPKLYEDGVSSPGTFRMHTGDLERLDRMSAESALAKMYRMVQEETSIFNAFGQDLMLKQLNNLKKDLEAIRQQLGPVANGVVQERSYLLAEPFPETRNFEIEYWCVDRSSFHQVVRPGATLLPYKQVSVQPGSAKLITCLIPGHVDRSPDEKVSAFRTGLLTRNRIVSKQDIRHYILHAFAGLVEGVDIRGGIAVSKHPKQGLVRTVELLLSKSPQANLNPAEWTALLAGLEADLNHRSIHTAEYKLILHSPTQLNQDN